MNRWNHASARAPGRPKPGAIPLGDRLRYSADEGLHYSPSCLRAKT